VITDFCPRFRQSTGRQILSVTQSFFDERLMRRGTEALFNALEPLESEPWRDVGQLSADLQHGRHHQLRNEVVALLGRCNVAALLR